MSKLMGKLKQISHYCAQHDEFCSGCDLRTGEGETACRIQNVVIYMKDLNPSEWDFNKLERILDE